MPNFLLASPVTIHKRAIAPKVGADKAVTEAASRRTDAAEAGKFVRLSDNWLVDWDVFIRIDRNSDLKSSRLSMTIGSANPHSNAAR